jgi:NAD(P)-dependent dehydrogenase (short-subunit alcohol dehydrogenase family)
MTKHTKHFKPTDAPVWFITGCSTGFGLELTKQAIERGYRAVVTAAEVRFGGIGYFAAIEQGDATEVRNLFDVNVFGLTSMVQAVLPGMRQRRRGCIVSQSGDPVRGVRVIIKAVASGKPPHHLLLGNDALEGAMARLDERRQDFTAGEATARGTDCPKAAA